MQSSHLEYMQQALQLAKEGQYTVSPNPMVGCIIVKNGIIVGKGFHQRAGLAHAEIHALQQAEDKAHGADVYVTLEPCAHHGRTPPCTDALVAAKVKKVFVACLDPNPLVSGKGIDTLRAAGIEVEVGLCQEEALRLNEIFFHYITHRTPFVISKWAMSLDGLTITHNDDSKQISCKASRYHAHHLRQVVDAILVGAKTIHTDDPELTARYSHTPITKQPIRIILSTQGNLPNHAKIFNTSAKTIIASTKAIDRKKLSSAVENCIIPTTSDGLMNLHYLLKELGNREITSLLVEGGMETHRHFINANLVNKYHVYVAPVIIGSLTQKRQLSNVDIAILDKDAHITITQNGS